MQKLFDVPLPEQSLTVLSFGAGQDSTAILYKYIYDPEFALKYVRGKLVVVMADTLNEHATTYEHIEQVAEVCRKHDIEFFLLDPNDWATGDWKGGLVGFYHAKSAIGSKAFPKTCSARLKIDPIYKFLEFYVYSQYALANYGRKQGFYEFVSKYGKIRVLIGIAEKEEKRAKGNQGNNPKWFRECIEISYPLIEEGMDRQACQDYIRSVDMPVPFPSNCIFCPFLSKQELLYMYRQMPERYVQFVAMEAAKIEKNKDVENNVGVFGTKKLLPEILQEAIDEFGHMTTEELHAYKMSHGHCVGSSF